MCMSTGPMRCLWKQFEMANKSLHRRLQLNPRYYHGQHRELGTRIILREGDVGRVTLTAISEHDTMKEIRIYHNNAAQRYEICAVKKCYQETPRVPFSPRREVKFILRAVVLGWTLERLHREICDA